MGKVVASTSSCLLPGSRLGHLCSVEIRLPLWMCHFSTLSPLLVDKVRFWLSAAVEQSTHAVE